MSLRNLVKTIAGGERVGIHEVEAALQASEAEIADLRRSLSEVLIALDGREPEGGIYSSQAAQRVADLKRQLEQVTQDRDAAQRLTLAAHGLPPADWGNEPELAKRAAIAETHAEALAEALDWALQSMDRGDGVLEYTGLIEDGERARAALTAWQDSTKGDGD